LDFDEFTPELKDFLEAYRASEKSKKDAKAKTAAAAAGKAKGAEEAGDDVETEGAPPAKKARIDEPSPGGAVAENDTAGDEEDADHEHEQDDEVNDQAGDDADDKEDEAKKDAAEREPMEE
jgi:hypothetical protein